LGSKLSVLGIISTVGVSMFPFILPSSIDPASSLTVWNSSSSHTTLFIMLVVTAIFLPWCSLYTAWAFKVMWGRVTTEQVHHGRLLLIRERRSSDVVFRLDSRDWDWPAPSPF
jgi:cytochrome d ubiquinol oxidase subunit II